MFVLVESLAAALEGDFLLVHYSLGGCVCFGVRVCVGGWWVCVSVFGGSHVTRYADINPKQQKLLCVLHPHIHTSMHIYTKYSVGFLLCT